MRVRGLGLPINCLLIVLSIMCYASCSVLYDVKSSALRCSMVYDVYIFNIGLGRKGMSNKMLCCYFSCY